MNEEKNLSLVESRERIEVQENRLFLVSDEITFKNNTFIEYEDQRNHHSPECNQAKKNYQNF